MPKPAPETPRHWRRLRWLAPAALAALAPKCGLCVLAYLGLGAALGLGGPEFCGPPNDSAGYRTVLLIALGAAAAAGCFLYCFRKRKRSRAANF